MLKELELKLELYQRAFIHNSMCTTTREVEVIWNRPDVYTEIYKPGNAELRKPLDMTNDRAHAMQIYKLRSEVLKRAIEDIQWKVDFLKEKGKRSWWKKAKEYLFPNKDIISFESL